MLTNDVTLHAIQGDVFRFTVLPHEDLTGLLVRCNIRVNGILVKHLDTLAGIVLGTYDPTANTTLVIVTVGASVTALWTFAVARFAVDVVPANQDEVHKISKGIIELTSEESYD